MNKPKSTSARFPRLWNFAEHKDYMSAWPRWFWRWLLRRLDKINGYDVDYFEKQWQ